MLDEAYTGRGPLPYLLVRQTLLSQSRYLAAESHLVTFPDTDVIREMHVSPRIDTVRHVPDLPFRVKTDPKLVSVIKTDPLDDKVQEYGVLMQYQDIIGETVAEIQTVQISLEPVREVLDPLG